MFGIGLPELITILILATIFLGPEGMVKFASQAGRWLAKFRRETEGVTKEFKEAFNLELNPQEFKDALDLGIDPKDPLGLSTTAAGAKAAKQPAARPSGAGTTQWNLPTSSSLQTSGVPPASVQTAAALASGVGEDSLTAEGKGDQELAPLDDVEPRPRFVPEPVAADTSPDAEAVSIGVAEWIPEDDKVEATVIGEPLWVVEDELADAQHVDGADEAEHGDAKGRGSADSEGVA
jgi:Sec-independent protein translocase protein TatA